MGETQCSKLQVGAGQRQHRARATERSGVHHQAEYLLAKNYRPIYLLECLGKLLEKV